MNHLVISTSLNPESRSRILAERVFAHLAAIAPGTQYVDLVEFPLPMCDAAECYNDPNARELTRLIAGARGIVLATPIYNYTCSASAKNLLELTGGAWREKTVGFLCAAGGRSSYMAIMNLANSLMLDFRSVIVPRFVYTDDADFDGQNIVNAGVEARLEELAETVVRMSEFPTGAQDS